MIDNGMQFLLSKIRARGVDDQRTPRHLTMANKQEQFEGRKYFQEEEGVTRRNTQSKIGKEIKVDEVERGLGGGCFWEKKEKTISQISEKSFTTPSSSSSSFESFSSLRHLVSCRDGGLILSPVVVVHHHPDPCKERVTWKSRKSTET